MITAKYNNTNWMISPGVNTNTELQLVNINDNVDNVIRFFIFFYLV